MAYTDEKNKYPATLIENDDSLNGVGKETQDKAYNNSFNASDDVNAQKNKTDEAFGNFEDIAGKTDIVDQETKDRMNQKFEVSDEWNQANDLTQGLMQQLISGKTSYTDSLQALISQIQNREDFEYDVDKDPLFQQALASAMNSGRSAMQDTIGQASALTGGYGSTYATSAGNQAYNSFIEDAYNNLPEYYQMALEAYQMEGQELYNQFNMLSTADATEYQRMYNSWDASYRNTQDMWNREFSTWEADVNQAFNSANFQLNEHGQLVENAYNIFNANMNMYESMYAKEYQSWQDQVTQAQQFAQLLNSDWWSTTNFNEGVRQYEKNYAQTEYWNQKDLDYKNASLAEQKRQYNYSIGDTNNDGVVDEDERAAMGSGETFTLTDPEISACKDILENGGSRDDVLDYLAAKGKIPSGEEDDAVLDSVLGIKSGGTSTNVSKVKTGLASTGAKGNNFQTREGDNFDVYIGDTPYRVENKGKVDDAKLVNKLNGVGANNNDVFVYDGAAYVKYADAYWKVGATNVLFWQTSGYEQLVKELQK